MDDSLAQPSSYEDTTIDLSPMENYCEFNPQCGAYHLSGGPCDLACATELPQNPPFCTNPNKLGLQVLDNLCGLAGSYGGGFCNGGFNWGPGGYGPDVMSQSNLENHGTPVFGVNCAVDIKTRTCKYNRSANANQNGDILYKNLTWDLQTLCSTMKKEMCNDVYGAFGLCAWEDDSSSCQPSDFYKGGLLPICLSKQPTKDCSEEDNGSFCTLQYPENPGQIIGRCKSGFCLYETI